MGPKEQLVQRFRDYLEAVEEPQDDDAEMETPDLYSLFSELAALKTELRLESRQVKTSLELFRELLDELQGHKRHLESELERCQRDLQQTHIQAQRDLLLGIIELRDRIEAGLRGASRYRPGLLVRANRRNARFLNSLSEGQEITLRRLDSLLSQHQVQPIEAIGSTLDPQCMRVHSVKHRPQYENGQVIEEISKGYRRGEDILRIAEVIVNKIEG
ncbi:MAG: nucleotide exchange factor GrpE [Pseudomonadota bacterium]